MKLHEKLNWMFSDTAQVSHQACQFLVSSVCLLVRVTSWCRQVNWGNCGTAWVNCAVLCVKETGKESSEGCAIVCQNCAVYSVCPSGMTSHIKIAQFNWECIGRLKLMEICSHRRLEVSWTDEKVSLQTMLLLSTYLVSLTENWSKLGHIVSLLSTNSS
jgi:hypothetical protein